MHHIRAQSLAQKLLCALLPTVKADGDVDAAEHCYLGWRVSISTEKEV